VLETQTAKDVRDLKRRLSLRIIDNDYGTRIFAIAISKTLYGNEELRIPTQCGEPICEDVHDMIRDCYLVEGVEYLDLGEIPICAVMDMDDIYGWRVDVPIPTNIMKRYMSETQKSKFLNWKQRFRPKEYVIKLIQMRNVY
jgi:hypothetical protein